LSVELVNLLLQFRDDVALHRKQRYRGQPQDRILHEHKEDARQQCAPLKHRGADRFADEPAQRLALGCDHWNDLSRRVPLKVR
jgi:hypothetical protein